MKEKRVGKLLGLTLAIVMGISVPMQSFAQVDEDLITAEELHPEEESRTEEELPETSEQSEESLELTEEETKENEEAVEDAEVEDTEEVTEPAEASEDVEVVLPEQPAAEVGDAENNLLTSGEELVSFPVVFEGFGKVIDEFIAANPEKAYSLSTFSIRDANNNGT